MPVWWHDQRRAWSSPSTGVWTRATTTPPARRRRPRTAPSPPSDGSVRSSSTQPPARTAFPPGAGWWKGPSHTTYNALLTSKPFSPMIGLAGLLKLLDVVRRLQAAQQDCACAPQEAGVLCPSSPPHPSSSPALPPAHEDTRVQSVGPVTARHSAPAAAPAQSARRTAGRSAGTTTGRWQSGGHA